MNQFYLDPSERNLPAEPLAAPRVPELLEIAHQIGAGHVAKTLHILMCPVESDDDFLSRLESRYWQGSKRYNQ